MLTTSQRRQAEERFATVFAHLDLLVAYARRRGGADPEAIAAEAMAIAWRRLADVPVDDARPWLIATTRNLLLADHRRRRRTVDVDPEIVAPAVDGDGAQALLARDLDPRLARALRSLSEADREALLLVAWEDLTPAQAAASLGITPVAFRVRLHRARRRFAAETDAAWPRAERAPGVPALSCPPRTEWRNS